MARCPVCAADLKNDRALAMHVANKHKGALSEILADAAEEKGAVGKNRRRERLAAVGGAEEKTAAPEGAGEDKNFII